MFRYVSVFLCTCALGIPVCSEAAILINEIAWMGTPENANDEWIELYNNGADTVTLDGWTLSDNVSLEIPLAGTMSGGEYAVLERTDDSSAPGLAFLIYTGALSNEGRTLTLFRADGSIEDQVAGGANWGNIGGDNTTKHTAQRTNSGWVTAESTPGRANASISSSGSSTQSTSTASPSSSVLKTKGLKTNIELKPSGSQLNLQTFIPSFGYVNQPIEMLVEPYGIGETLMASLTYEWSFGDTHNASGTKSQTHTYRHPGEYVLFVRAAFADHETLVRQEIAILPIMITLARNATGDVLIQNDAPYEVDLSGYRLIGDDPLTFPNHTVILEHGTLVIERARIENGPKKVLVLYDQQGNAVAMDAPSNLVQGEFRSAAPIITQASTQTTPKIARPAVAEASQILSASEAGTASTAETVTPVGSSQAALSIGGGMIMEKLPYVGLVLLIILATLVVYIKREEKDVRETRE